MLHLAPKNPPLLFALFATLFCSSDQSWGQLPSTDGNSSSALNRPSLNGPWPADGIRSRADFSVLSRQYSESIWPLLRDSCCHCHNDAELEGELSFSAFDSLDAVRQQPGLWQNVLLQIESGEMPPAGSVALTASQHEHLRSWLKQYMAAEAIDNAGDPGPVVLRRLSNDEYTYSLRDLTGLENLAPAEQFPVDGAAGEGFTNVGAGLVMSPALFSKYLKSAKEVAQHIVLLPDGIAFSEKLSRRDRTDELLGKIRDLYLQHTILGGDTSRNLQGVRFLSQDAGVIDLQPYIATTIQHKELLTVDPNAIVRIAATENLNAKYLGLIWQALTSKQPSILLDPIRSLWNTATLDDAQRITRNIVDWQSILWQFTTVGHIGKRDGPKAWQEPVTPLASQQEIEFKLSSNRIYLTTFAAGDGQAGDVARWSRPRLSLPNLPDVSLLDASSVAQLAIELRARELARTAQYLNVIGQHQESTALAQQHATKDGLDLQVLDRWTKLVKLASPKTPQPEGHFTSRLDNVGGYADVRGWGQHATPSLIANRSENTYRFSTLTVPGNSVLVHPAPDRQAVVYWQSPINGPIKLSGLIADADANCGNGVHWSLTHLSPANPQGRTLDEGSVENGGSKTFSWIDQVSVQVGDLLRLSIDPADRDHVCDTTQVRLRIESLTLNSNSAQPAMVWDLEKDVAPRVEHANPLGDQYHHEAVWHFCESPLPSESPPFSFLHASLLGDWNHAIQAGEIIKASQIAATLQTLLLGNEQLADGENANTENLRLRDEVLSWQGLIGWLELAVAKHKASQTPASDRLVDILTVPGNQEYMIPEPFQAATLKATVSVAGPKDFDAKHPTASPDDAPSGSLQVTVSETPADHFDGLANSTLQHLGNAETWSDPPRRANWKTPILVRAGSEKELLLQQQIKQFRDLFPAAMCYVKIVPVDEVVTLTLYHREDQYLKDLMLDELQSRKLDELWEQLHFVSQDALQLVDAFEQLWQYATQDADPSAFEPMRIPIMQRAEIFRQTLRDAEGRHVQDLTAFAQRAWRHHQREQTAAKVDDFYTQLRREGIEHLPAIELTCARILVAPEFLYKLEQPPSDSQWSPINNHELATRLGYFLWSSVPDATLDDQLTASAFTTQEQRLQVLTEQTQRMLRDPKIRRLAEQFGCQWLGVRDFEEFDEKSETVFADFKQLRSSMAEEATLFFTDFFQNDRSILSLLNADHAFVDDALAQFYKLPADVVQAAEPVSMATVNSHWKRVDGMQAVGRGGVLGLAATLAKQSGASRTSPILRGNWVYETLLGQHLPKPPKNVPILPETVPGGLTERELIEMHSSAPECAKCHAKIDGYGFALEAFDAIGQARSGHNTHTLLPDGAEIEGLAGLRDYLLEQRRHEFVHQFCRKLLGYALGRSVQLSDQPLLDEIAEDLRSNDYRVSVAIQRIVTSTQFTSIRGLMNAESEAGSVGSE